MLRRGLTISAALLGFIAFGAPARAASFDCARARQADEVTVCRNARLSEMDTEMGALWYAYSRVPMLMGARGARQDEAAAFLARRRACGRNIACLTAAYRSRIVELRANIEGAMNHFAQFL